MQIDAEQIKSLIDYFETQAEQQREYIKNCIDGGIYSPIAEYAAYETAYKTCAERLKDVLPHG